MSRDRQRGDKQAESGFAGRWSRLKQEAKAEPEALEPDTGEIGAEAAPADAEVEALEDDQRPDEEIIEELGLPDPDTLKTGDDFSAFMAKAVPARIRNRALRKLWISNPVLANLDELLDYGEDFTDAATVIENLQTAYQVGKGFVDRMAGLPEKDAEESDDELSSESAEASDESAVDEGDAENTPELSDLEPDPEEAPISTDAWASAEEKIPIRQRMRFRLMED